MELNMEFKRLSDGMEVALSGELHFIDAQLFMQKVPAMVEDRGNRICLQMKNLKFIDSSGLGSILYVSEALRMRGQKLEIQHANDNIKKLLKVIQNVGTFYIID